MVQPTPNKNPAAKHTSVSASRIGVKNAALSMGISGSSSQAEHPVSCSSSAPVSLLSLLMIVAPLESWNAAQWMGSSQLPLLTVTSPLLASRIPLDDGIIPWHEDRNMQSLCHPKTEKKKDGE
jgi:hypothetical protein